MRYLWFGVMIWLSSAALVSASELKPLNDFRGTYYFAWTGIPVAKLWFAAEQSGNDYTYTATLKSRGLVRMFKKVKAYTVSTGFKAPHGWQTRSYRTESKDSDNTKEVHLSFQPDGTLSERVVTDEDDPNYRKPVDEALLKAVQTYGSAFFELRRLTHETIVANQKSFETDLYDGKRLMHVKAVLDGKEEVDVNGKSVQAHRLKLSRTLTAGFTEKEKKRYQEGEPFAYLYFSDDADFVPIKLSVTIKFGLFHGYLVKE
ncbi:MAG: DUF3108 domain-containing protein [Rickettsiales bacterium]|nr:DUF3108 domain-containing protein [Rickettsiales bacterium]